MALNGNYSGAVTSSWRCRVPLRLEGEQRISACVFIFNRTLLDVYFAAGVAPLCPLAATPSPLSPVTPLLCFPSTPSLIRSLCLKSKLPQRPAPGPEAVIDQRERENGARRERGSQGGQRRACLNRRVYFCLSRCVIIGQKTPGTCGLR